MVYAQLASDGACTRLKNQHLILSCLLRIYWIFYLAFIYLFQSLFLFALNKLHHWLCVRWSRQNFLKQDMRKKHLLLTRVPQKCNNPQLNKLLFYYFPLVFCFVKKTTKRTFYFYLFYLISTKVLAALRRFSGPCGELCDGMG
jgi:hypothetical protein